MRLLGLTQRDVQFNREEQENYASRVAYVISVHHVPFVLVTSIRLYVEYACQTVAMA